MHQNFYHWHSKAEIKPDVSALEARWAAAAKCAVKLAADDILVLLRMALFPVADVAFNARFSEELVKSDPTFAIVDNENLLRVMAAAALSSKMESWSTSAHCIALAIRAANFPKGRIQPITNDLVDHAALYLSQGAEAYRPDFKLETIASAEKKVESSIAALKEASASGDAAKLSSSIEAFGKLVVVSLKESHGHLGRVMGRITEESQVIWWVVGKRSPELNSRRQLLTPVSYVAASAKELSDRVTVPPPASAGDILDEVLSHCEAVGKDEGTIVELAATTDKSIVNKISVGPLENKFAPISFALWETKTRGRVSGAALKEIGVNAKDRFKVDILATQYFYELLFDRVFKTLS